MAELTFLNPECSFYVMRPCSANTPRFSCPNGAMIFSAAIPIGFQIDNQKKKALYSNFKWLSQDGGRAKLAENLRASPFDKRFRMRPLLG
jgi:hypothetical protein